MSQSQINANTDPQESQELSDDQLQEVAGGTQRPPSGDLNPSDLTNPTVDTSEVIDPSEK